MKGKLANAGTAILVVCALFVTGLVIQRELVARGTARAAYEGTKVAQWNSFLGGVRSEAPGAEVTVALFADYTCRYCRQFEATLDSILPTFGGKVRVVHQHFPIVQDGVAFAAAVAAECAGEQGEFAGYHALLYQSQDSLEAIHQNGQWQVLASQAGITDLDRFRSCVGEERPAALVRSNREIGAQMGVEVTPTVVINGRRFRGAPPADVLMQRLTAALDGSTLTR